jgi:hypothetical protein
MKFLDHFRFKLEQINPRKFTIVIHKAYIVFVSSYRFRCRPPNIRNTGFRG